MLLENNILKKNVFFGGAGRSCFRAAVSQGTVEAGPKCKQPQVMETENYLFQIMNKKMGDLY